MNTVIFAYHDIGCRGLQAVLDAGYKVAAVFTHNDAPGERIFFDSVARLAATNDIAVHAADDVNHPIWVEYVKELRPDFIFSFYYRDLLCREILDTASRGAYNLHGSLLPRYRGRAPLNWVLVNGERETGVTLHAMTSRADAGDIVAQQGVAIAEDDTALSLHNKLCTAASELLRQTLPKLANGSASHSPQDENLATTFGRRTPADGELSWQNSARALTNLVRAVTDPYPGAFAYAADRRFIVWQAKPLELPVQRPPGTVIGLDPLQIACAEGALQIDLGQADNGLCVSGPQLARELHLTAGLQLTSKGDSRSASKRKTKVLILGVNGFIGNHLTEKLIESGRYQVFGLDIGSDAIQRFVRHPDFQFVEGDISIHHEWIEYHIKKCDLIVPLVAIATPIEYTRNPLRVFELDFEENLKIVRYCHKYGKRVVFPSTSEVYGMCDEDSFDEDNSLLVLGPINKQRWIYSASKQLLDRVIWAYGQHHGLQFTLFRPFNWMGPRLDTLDAARIGSSRVVTQFILNLVEGTPIKLIDGGAQKRCFTDIEDGIAALFRIIANDGGRCDGQIMNIGNPVNEASIEQLGKILVDAFEAHPLR